MQNNGTQNGATPYNAWGAAQEFSSFDASDSSSITEQPTAKPVFAGGIFKNSRIKEIRPYLIAGGFFISLWGLSALGNLASRQVQPIPQDMAVPTPVAEEVAPPTPDPDSLQVRRAEAWESLQQACAVNLQEVANETSRQIDEARAAKWQLYANQQCNEDQTCFSTSGKLEEHFNHHGAALLKTASGYALPSKATDTNEFRKGLGTVRDIAFAMGSGVSKNPPRGTSIARLAGAIDACGDAARKYNSLTKATREEALTIPQTNF